MFQFLKVGLISAGAQFIVVILVTFLVSFSSLRGLIVPLIKSSTLNAEIMLIYPLVRWLFLLTAIGISLTNSQLMEITADRIHQASRRMMPTVPGHEEKTLLALLVFATAGLVILTLSPPPDFMITLGSNLKSSGTVWIAWAGLTSVCVANFGTMAHAAWKAVRLRT